MKIGRWYVLVCVVFIWLNCCSASDVGKRFPAEKKVFQDKVTGVTITALTTDPANDQKIYQTHPHWTPMGSISFSVPIAAVQNGDSRPLPYMKSVVRLSN